MSKRESDKRTAVTRRVNVEIAPGNKRRLSAYIAVFNQDPDRRHPSLTVADALNAALDEFLSEELPRLQSASVPADPLMPKAGKRPSKKEE